MENEVEYLVVILRIPPSLHHHHHHLVSLLAVSSSAFLYLEQMHRDVLGTRQKQRGLLIKKV